MKSKEDRILELGRQLAPGRRCRVALELLCGDEAVPTLSELQSQARPGLAAALRRRGLEIERMSPEQIEEGIQRIIEEA